MTDRLDERLRKLSEELSAMLGSELLTYEQTKQLTSSGIYLVYRGDEVIYVGKTTRNGKTRLREMAADYRSHTLNRKLLRRMLNEKLKVNIPPMRKTTKKKLVEDGIISEEQFRLMQGKVNGFVKEVLKFRYYAISEDRLPELEHFAIALLNPEMND